MTTLKRTLPLAAAAFLMLASQALAVPLPGLTQTFGISPARRHVIGRPGMALTPTTVTNGTNSGYRVSVFPAILSQDLSGAFTFAETPAALNDSKLALVASPDSFTMAPGSTAVVDLRWNLLPPGQKWLAMGVVFQGTGVGQTGAVHVVTRLLSVNFLSLPGLNRISGVFTGVFAQQLSPRVLQILARVKNTGNTFGAPSDGHLTIRDSLGDVVYRARWAGDVVLPGAQRDFPINVRKLLPAGSYTATVSMRFGRQQSSATSFVLVGPNQLPTPAIAIQNFNASGVVGAPAHVTARIVSDGTAPAALTLHLFLGRASAVGRGASALATGQASYRHLDPRSVTKLSSPLGEHLRKGAYDVFATWTDPTGARHTLETEFTTTTAVSFLQKFWSFIKKLLILWVILLLLGVLIAIAALVRRLTDRQRQIEAELAAARERLRSAGLGLEAAPDDGPAPPRPGRVRTSPKGPRPSSGALRSRGAISSDSSARGEARSADVSGPSRRPRRSSEGTNGGSAAARSSSAKSNGPSSTAKSRAGSPNGSNAKAKGSSTRATSGTPAMTGNGAKPAIDKLSGAKSPGRTRAARKSAAAKPAAPKRSTRKPSASSANGAKGNGAKANGAKAAAPKRGARTSAGPRDAAGNGSKPATAKAINVEPNRPRADTNTTGAKPSRAKSNGATSNGAKTGPRSRSTGVRSNPAPSTATPAQPASTPSSQSGSGAEPRSTDVRANRAGELLALASRSHARRPLPSDQDDA